MRLITREQDSTRSQASHSVAPATENSSTGVQHNLISKQQDMAIKLAVQALLSTLWPCATSSVPAADGVTRRPDQSTLPGRQGAAAVQFAKIVMSLPQLLSGMPSQVRTQLTSLRALEAIMPALDAITEEDPGAEQKHPGRRDTALSPQCRVSCQRCELVSLESMPENNVG